MHGCRSQGMALGDRKKTMVETCMQGLWQEQMVDTLNSGPMCAPSRFDRTTAPVCLLLWSQQTITWFWLTYASSSVLCRRMHTMWLPTCSPACERCDAGRRMRIKGGLFPHSSACGSSVLKECWPAAVQPVPQMRFCSYS